ncbi:MAG: GNAT family N-acetyltransferase [Bacillota bacterium]
MKFEFVPINLEYAKEIKGWRYNGFVKNIYVEPYFNSLDEKTGKMKGPDGCEGFVVLNQDKLVGLFEYYFRGDIIEIGLALNPDFVGKGYGTKLVKQGINFGIDKFNYKEEYIMLTVNIENKPAINVYKKVGFKEHKKEENSIEMRKYI